MRLIFLAVLASGGSAWGYSSPSLFDTGPSDDTTGGAGGIYYTGSPRFQGQDCSGCHRGERAVSVRVSSVPEDLLRQPYRPGAVYHIEVDLGRDLLGPRTCGDAHPGDACNLDLFALEIDTAAGRPAGRLCPLPFEGDACPEQLGTPTILTRDGTAVIANSLRFGADGQPAYRDGETARDFYWRAPDHDVGPLHVWIGAVDGDGGQSSPDKPSDYDGDATGVFRLLICGPSGCADEAAATEGGCTSTPGPVGWTALLGLVVLGLGRRRPRLARRLVVLVGLVLVSGLASGCAVVKPWQRGTLARRCMALEGDPEEATLEQHVFAYREGAAGAHGGGGGGCGCN
ncbi:MAG: DUF4266 domain-containing protein [bacterium]